MYNRKRSCGMARTNRYPLIPTFLTITVRVVPRKTQRYDTIGDWRWRGRTLRIRISREIAAKQREYLALVFVHELIEALLCRSARITTDVVDSFDRSFVGDSEPGDDPLAPYHREHTMAESVERQFAKALNLSWPDYQRALKTYQSGA